MCARLRGALLVLGLAAATAAPSLALPPSPLAEVGPFVSFALGGIPGGGHLLVWQDPLTFVVMAQRISAAGFPASLATSVATLDDDGVAIETVAVTA